MLNIHPLPQRLFIRGDCKQNAQKRNYFFTRNHKHYAQNDLSKLKSSNTPIPHKPRIATN